MRRSALVVLATVLVSMFPTALPAAAAGASVASPKADQEITGSVPVEVAVARAVGEDVTSVRARLSGSGSDTYSITELSCMQGCDTSSAGQRWVGTFNPKAPFGRSGPVRNGVWYIQASANGGEFGSGAKVYLSLPPSSVRNLKAVPQERTVQLSWTPAPEPDISGYRVERSTGDGWQRVTNLGPDATSYTDNVRGSGAHSYRIVSLRPSGKPDDPELSTNSASASADVSAPSGTTSHKDPPSQPDSDAQSGKAGSGKGSGPGTAEGSTGRGGSSAEDAPGGGDARRERRGPLAGSVPPPPPARRDFGFNLRSLGRVFGLDSPQEAEGEEEGYFGEGEGYSEELDYSGVDPATGEPIAVPLPDAGLRGMLISQLTDRPLLASLAFGLLFVVLAVLILRWIRRSPARAPSQDGPSAASPPPSAAIRRFFKVKGDSATPAAVPSPTTAPLSPRTRSTHPVAGQEKADDAANGRVAVASRPEPRRTRTPTNGPLFARDAEAQGGFHDEVRGSRDGERG